jgi:hypothetical protein
LAIATPTGYAKVRVSEITRHIQRNSRSLTRASKPTASE